MKYSVNKCIAISIILSTAAYLPAAAQDVSVRSGDRVFYGGCVAVDDLLLRPEQKFPESDAEAFGLGALASAFVGPLVKGTLNRFGAALRRAAGADSDGNALTEVISVTQPIELKHGDVPACVQLVSGDFFTSIDQPKGKINTGMGAAIDAELEKHNIPISESPSIFVEFGINRSIDGSALTLAPTFFHYGSVFGERLNDNRRRSRRSNSKRGIVGAVSFHKLGVEYTDETANASKIVIGKVNVGGSVSFQPLPAPPADDNDLIVQIDDPSDIRFSTKKYFAKFEQESEWFANFNQKSPDADVETGDSGDGGSEIGADLGGGQSSGDDDPVYVPMNLTIKLTETRDINKFLLFVSEIFDGGKESLETAITNELTPATRRQARITAINAELTARTEYDSAVLTAKNAIDSYCDSPSDNTADDRTTRRTRSHAARAAQDDVNTKAIIAGKTKPFATLIAISGGPVSSDYCN
jgi:hypothetical protein